MKHHARPEIGSVRLLVKHLRARLTVDGGKPGFGKREGFRHPQRGSELRPGRAVGDDDRIDKHPGSRIRSSRTRQEVGQWRAHLGLGRKTWNEEPILHGVPELHPKGRVGGGGSVGTTINPIEALPVLKRELLIGRPDRGRHPRIQQGAVRTVGHVRFAILRNLAVGIQRKGKNCQRHGRLKHGARGHGVVEGVGRVLAQHLERRHSWTSVRRGRVGQQDELVRGVRASG